MALQSWSSARTLNSVLRTLSVFCFLPDLALNSVVTVQARATDTAGNIGTATAQVRSRAAPPAPGYLQGEIYDDTRGLLLAGQQWISVTRRAGIDPDHNARRRRIFPGSPCRRLHRCHEQTRVHLRGAERQGQTRERLRGDRCPADPDKHSAESRGFRRKEDHCFPLFELGGHGNFRIRAGANIELTDPAECPFRTDGHPAHAIGNQGLAALLPAGWSPIGIADIRALTSEGAEIAAQDFTEEHHSGCRHSRS